MRRERLALLFLIISAVISHVSAQSVMLDLGAQVGVVGPDLEIKLPLTLNAPGEGPVRIAMEVGYPVSLLRFFDIKPGSSVEQAKGKVRAQKKPVRAGDAEQVIAIEIESPQPLASGALATLNFGITGLAKSGTEIRIRNISRTAKAASGEDLAARGAEGLISLIEPLVACFFYMH